MAVTNRPRHEAAPALQAMMIDYMRRTPWDDGGGTDTHRPQVLFVYTNKISKVTVPPRAYDDHPRIMVKRMADIFTAARASGELTAKPADMVGAGMLIEFWQIAFADQAERDHWRTRDFSEHPRAVEARMLIVHQVGHPPVAAMHNRDRRRTGEVLTFPKPTMSDEPLLPGGAAPPLLIHLERLCRALLSPPATFLSGR